VDFLDGFILAVESNSGRFVGSALNDGTDYNGLDFATAEGSPDNLIRNITDHRQAILIGERSTEIWWNAGGEGFPFQRLGGGFIEQGGLARLGVTKADHSVFWLANDRTIRRLSGSTAVRVSQHGVETALAKMTTVSDCEAFSLTWNGHVLVWFRFPAERQTWVLDVTTGEWFESSWPIVAAETYNGRVYVQHENGSVGYLTDSVYTLFGENPRYSVTFPNIYSGGRQFFSQLDLTMRTGDAPANVTPKLTLEVSADGGNLWHTMPIRELGRTGDYARVLRWGPLGTSRDLVLRVTLADPVPFHLVAAELDAFKGQR
jgi:hypothetical protein